MLKPTDKNRRVSSFFMWLFSRALGLFRTLVRRREPRHPEKNERLSYVKTGGGTNSASLHGEFASQKSRLPYKDT